MTLSDLSIQRPVLTWVMNLALIVFGVLGLVRLGVDQFPDMEFPRAMVQARLEGANPEGIEEDVTEVLEEHLNSIAGLREISSVSSPGAATISLEFELGTDIDVAIQDVRDKLGFARFFLPRDLEPPVVSKMDMHRSAVLWIPTQTGRTRVESSEMLRYVVKPAMETIPGVSGATIFGQQDRNIRIWLNGEALRARGLAANDVLSAIQREHVEVPAGSIEGPRLDYAVKTMAEYESLDALRDMVIAHAEGAPVRLGDVARVEDAGEELTTLARFWGEESIGLGIMKQSGANTVAIADAVYERIDQLNRSLPHDFQIHTREKLIDFSKPIRESVDETNFALFTGALLAVITVFVFLRRWRPTLIVAAAIPLSLIATFGVTFLMGFTLNTMTLLAMALAVGVVIDDAIVVLENIERHRESGEESFEAAHRGTREIAFAATACTFSIAVVFLPAAFASGMVGNFLGEFGLTVAAAVILSLFVALTLTPMLAARVPPARERAHGSIYHYLEIGFQRLEQGYRAALAWVFAHRGVTLAGAAGSLAVSFILFGSLGKEFFPPSDQGLLMVQYETPPGSSLEHTHAMAQKLERWLLEQPELSGLFAAVGGGGPGMSRSHYTGVFASILKPKEERERSVQEFARDAREVFATVPGIRARVMDMSSMMSGGSRDGAFAVELRGNLSLEQLDEVSDRFMAALWERGGFVDMDKSLKLGLPELQVIPDRDKAAELGVDAATLGTVVRAMIGGMDVASFKDAGRRHDIRVRLDEADRATPEAVERLYVRTKGGDVVELRNLVDVHMGAAPSDISRTQRQRSVRVMSNLTTEKRLGDAIEDARIVAAEVLPEEVSLAFSGQAEQLLESFEQFGFSMALAVIVIYLVLAAQFESFVHPLTVMLALPLAMVGALGALFVFGMTINLFSLIGIIMLFGLVTKNSILLVDYANHLRREEGLEKSEAMRRAAPIRLRPVLMTAVSMIFGVLPAAIGLGPGAESRQPMAVATAAGMLSSTVLTLLVVPVFYVVFEDGIDWLKGRLRALRGARPEDRPADRLAHARTGARPGEL